MKQVQISRSQKNRTIRLSKKKSSSGTGNSRDLDTRTPSGVPLPY